MGFGEDFGIANVLTLGKVADATNAGYPILDNYKGEGQQVGK